jgi:cell division GTPase FtsZ
LLEIMTNDQESSAKIIVVGVGGAGNNAVNRMIISATLGAVWAVICVCIPLRFALLEKFITYVPVTLIMAMIMLSGTKDFKQKTSKQLKLYMRNLLKAGAGMILIAPKIMLALSPASS